jgi:hemolysin activation/secretion protein
VPTKGIAFLANASYFSNTSQKEFFQRYVGKMQIYLPLGSKFSVAIKGGGAATVCKPGILKGAEFYEHSVIGGPDNLRGFWRERFWGKSAFYNNNELRFITDLRTHLLNAKIGLLVFFDDGRVWMPGENSNTLHTSYGTGILFAPFNKIAATLTYGISKETRIYQLSLNKLL